jgi:hypothetical protein
MPPSATDLSPIRVTSAWPLTAPTTDVTVSTATPRPNCTVE